MQVFYFGGYLATQDDVGAWRASLQKKLPDATIWAYPWPDGASAGDPLATWTHDDSQHIADLIFDGDEPIIIVGHSSGCAIANDVAEHVLNDGYLRFRLIALDGFTPGPKLMALPGTVRWSALNVRTGVTSRNYVTSDPPHYRVWDHAKVSKEWPLHGSLVNLAVSDDYPAITEIYRNCDANLDVLELGDAKQVS